MTNSDKDRLMALGFADDGSGELRLKLSADVFCPRPPSLALRDDGCGEIWWLDVLAHDGWEIVDNLPVIDLADVFRAVFDAGKAVGQAELKAKIAKL